MLQFIKKNWIKVIIAIVLLLIIVNVFRAATKKGASGANPTGGIGVKKVFKCNPDAKLNRQKVLKKGVSDSQEVCYLQGWLNTWYGAGLKEDGDFGTATEKALIQHTNKAYGSLDWIGA